MSTAEPRYPQFLRKKRESAKRGEEFHYEIDTGHRAKVLDDGRPIVLEYWYDTDTALDFVTAFYSVIDIEEWRSEEHKDYLVRNSIMAVSDPLPSNSVYVDSAGNEMWSITWVLR